MLLVRENRQHPRSTQRKGFQGFTLIELLVVLLIISIVAGVAMLNFGRNQDREIKLFAQELVEMLKLAQDRALLEAKVMGLVIKDDQLYFVSLDHDTKTQKYSWQMLNDETLFQHSISKNLAISVQTASHNDDEDQASDETENHVGDLEHGEDSSESTDEDDADNSAVPQILIYNNRDFSPFMITLSQKHDKPRYAIIGKASGDLTLKSYG